MKIFLSVIFIWIPLLANGWSLAGEKIDSQPSPTPTPLSLQASVEKVLRDNPGLAEMGARARAMAAIPSQAGSLPDPSLSLNALNLPTDSFDLDQEAMTQLQIGISQALPFPGKLGLKEDAARHDASAAEADVDETRLRLIRDVKTHWWTLFYLDRALEIVKQNQDLLDQFVNIAQTKFTVGEGLQQDVLLAQVEHSKMLDREIRLTGMRRVAQARLSALLNIPMQRVIVLPRSAEQVLPKILPHTRLSPLAEASRPLLVSLRSGIEAARSRRDLAKRDYYPDFNVGAAYGFRQGNNPDGGSRADFASLRFSMSLPLYAASKQDKAVDQRNSELLRKTYALQDGWLKVQEQITQALADFQRSRDQAMLFRTGIIPQADQTVASMLAGYQVDKVDFLNLVSAQINLFNHQTQYWKSFNEAHQALARLEAAVGTEMIYE
jgi:outer membrane protein TolC